MAPGLFWAALQFSGEQPLEAALRRPRAVPAGRWRSEPGEVCGATGGNSTA